MNGQKAFADMTEAELMEVRGIDNAAPMSAAAFSARDELAKRYAARNQPWPTSLISFARKRDVVRSRREAKAMEAAGYRRHETDWEIHRGARQGEIIVDAVVSCDGKYVYTKLGGPWSTPP